MRLLGFFGVLFFVLNCFANIDIGLGYKYNAETGQVLDSENNSIAGLLLEPGLEAKGIQVTEETTTEGKKLLLLHASYHFYLYEKQLKSTQWSKITSYENEFDRKYNYSTSKLELHYSELFSTYVMVSTSQSSDRFSAIDYIANESLTQEEREQLSKAVSQWLKNDRRTTNLDTYLKDNLTDISQKLISTLRFQTPPPLPPTELSDETKISSEKTEIPTIAVMNERGERTDGWTMIESFTSDYLEDVKNDTYEQIDELRQIEDKILKNFLKAEGGSVKLLAPAGVGKSVLMRRIAYRLRVGDVPESLKQYRVRYFSAASLEAGSKFVGTIEARMNAMLEVAKKVPVLWFVDEAHGLVGAGISDGRPTNVLQSLKPALAAGTVKWLAASTPNEWAAAFATDEAMDRRFVRVDLAVPDRVLLLKILNKWLEKYKKAPISEALLEKIIFYSSEYAVEGAQPSKATQLLNEVYANADFKDQKTPITLENIQEAAQELYNVNPAEMERDKINDRFSVLQTKLQEIIGQDLAKNAILSQTVQIMAGMHDRTKPRYRFMFSGDKGLGKTEIVKLFAQAMNLPEGRIVMSEYASPLDIEALKARIAQLVRIHPMTVLSFDEFEKAHPRVQQALLGILESESFTYTLREGGVIRSATVQVKNTSMFILTNAGASYLASRLFSHPEPRKIGFALPTVENEPKDTRPAFSHYEFRQSIVNDGVDPYVLDRMDSVIPFLYFTPQEFAHIVYIHTQKIMDGINKNSQIQFAFQNLKDFAVDFTRGNFHPQASAREVLRNLNQYIRQTLASISLSQPPSDATIKIAWKDGSLGIAEDAPETELDQQPQIEALSCKQLF